ncbi:MAG: TlpA family protein disulfide reductase [Spirochaetes bacterium]|nr:TlpA family protein disulfide reductase [Spirochaetota bacterium]
MKKAILIIFIVMMFISNLISGEKELIKDVYELINQKKYNDAFLLVEKAVKEFGETEMILRAKYKVLLRQENYKDALKIALKKERNARWKNPLNGIDVAIAYIKLKNEAKAFDWFDEAVDRGYTNFNYLYSDDFDFVKNHERLKKIITKIKDNIGLGKQAKDFNVKLFSGDKFVLSEQKGKVVLIYFWLIQCDPCSQGVSNLKKCYNEFKDKKFEIIGISLDKDKKELQNYIEKENINWKILFSGEGWKDEIKKLYGANFIPCYWLIDKKGILRYYFLSGKNLREEILKLVSE